MSAVEQVTVLPTTSLAELGVEPVIDKQLGLRFSPLSLVKLQDNHLPGTTYLGFVHHPFVGEHLAYLLDLMKPNPDITPEWRYFHSRQGIEEDFRIILEARGILKPWNPNQVPSFQKLDGLHTNDPHIGQAFTNFIKNHGPSFYKALHDRSLTTTGMLGALSVVNLEKKVTANIDSIVDRLRGGSFDHNLRYQICFPPYKSLFDKFLGRRLERSYHHSYDRLPLREQAFMLSDFLEELTAKQRFKLSIAYITQNPILLVDPTKQKAFGKNEWLAPRKGFHFRRADDDTLEIRGPQGSARIRYDKQELEAEYQWRVVGYEHSEDQNPASLFPLIAWVNIDGVRQPLTQEEAETYFKYLPISRLGRPDVKMGELYANFCSDIPLSYRKDKTGRLKSSPVIQQIQGAQVPVWIESPKQRAELYGSNTSVPAILEQYAA